MKAVFTIFFLISFWPSWGQNYYQKAFEEIIASSDAFKASDCYCDGHFMIMEEVVPFDEMSFMFSDKLTDTDKSTKQKKALSHLNINIGKKRSKHKVFFSEERNGIFFAEIFCDAKKKPTSFSMISSFGISHVYMFKTSQKGIVELIEQREISSN